MRAQNKPRQRGQQGIAAPFVCLVDRGIGAAFAVDITMEYKL